MSARKFGCNFTFALEIVPPLHICRYRAYSIFMRSKVKKSRIFKIAIVVIVIAAVLFFFSALFRKNSVPVVLESTISTARAAGTNALNSAATAVINNGISYDDLFHIRTNANGEVTMLEANSPTINNIAREIANLAQANLDAMGTLEVDVAAGTFTGLTLLIGFGPSVKLRILPIGYANCEFVSEFVAAGINQTLHKIYINVNAEIEVVTPLEDPMINVKVEVLVGENLIVGKIPDTYVVFGNNSSIYDLIP